MNNITSVTQKYGYAVVGTNQVHTPVQRSIVMRCIRWGWSAAGQPMPNLTRLVRYKVLGGMFPPVNTDASISALQSFTNPSATSGLTAVVLLEPAGDIVFYQCLNDIINHHKGWHIALVGSPNTLFGFANVIADYQADFGTQITTHSSLDEAVASYPAHSLLITSITTAIN